MCVNKRTDSQREIDIRYATKLLRQGFMHDSELMPILMLKDRGVAFRLNMAEFTQVQ